MSPVAIILTEEANRDLRTMTYLTYKKEEVVILKQELRDNEWITINHVALQIVIFDYIRSFRFEKALMKGAQYTIDYVTGYLREFVFNPETIDEIVRKNIYGYDIKEIPLSEDREGYRRDLENIDSFWRIPASPEKSRPYNSAKFFSTRPNASSLNSRSSGFFHNCRQRS